MIETELAASVGVVALPVTLLLSMVLGTSLLVGKDPRRKVALVLVSAPILTVAWLVAGGLVVAVEDGRSEAAGLFYGIGLALGLFLIGLGMADQLGHSRYPWFWALGVLGSVLATVTTLASAGFYSYLSTCLFWGCD